MSQGETIQERAARVVIENNEIDRLYIEQQQVYSNDIRLILRIMLFVLLYWPLWPLFRYGGLKRWAEAKKRALWDFAGQADELKMCNRQACLDMGFPDGIIPRRGLFG
jgi:hypothetical protein